MRYSPLRSLQQVGELLGGQATINDLANGMQIIKWAGDNKSTNYWPTGYNNEHSLERSANGEIHGGFPSAGSNPSIAVAAPTVQRGTLQEYSVPKKAQMTVPQLHRAIMQPILAGLWLFGNISNQTRNVYDIYYAYSSNSGVTWSYPGKIQGCANINVSYCQSNTGYGQRAHACHSRLLSGGLEGGLCTSLSSPNRMGCSTQRPETVKTTGQVRLTMCREHTVETIIHQFGTRVSPHITLT